MLDYEVINSPQEADASVIWLHGLGADGHDFTPIVPHLNLKVPSVRFLFPHAPMLAVTINNGYVMPAWYDIKHTNILAGEDVEGIKRSQQAVHELIEAEHLKGIAYERIILAGFSQGGAIVLYTGLRYPQKLGGVLALSTYAPLTTSLASEVSTINKTMPIFMAHGDNDPIVPYEAGSQSRDLLEKLGYTVEWHEYPMAHSVCDQEIGAIGQWLNRVLA